MNDKKQSNEPTNDERQQRERKSDSMTPDDCVSSTDTSKTTEQPKKKPSPCIHWSLLFEAVLVIATCATVGVAYFQWKTMERQSNIMKEQLDIMAGQTNAAFQQVSAAKSSIRIADKTLKDAQESGKEQSDRAEKSLNATIENFRLDQRAWIHLKEVAFKAYTTGDTEVPIKAGHPVRIKLSYTNTGKTPARVLATKTYVYVVEAGEKPPLQEKAIIATENRPFTLFPNSTYSHSEMVSEVYSAQQVEVIKNGQYIMYIYGMIPYEDVFGQIRWTQFCKYLDTDFTTLAVCSFYNETDKTRKYK